MQRMQRASQQPRKRDRLVNGRERCVRSIHRDHHPGMDGELAGCDQQRDRETTDNLLHSASAQPAAEFRMMLAAEHEHRGVGLVDHRFEDVSRGPRARHHRVHDGRWDAIRERRTQFAARASQRGQLQRLRDDAGPCHRERRAHIVGRVHQAARHIGCASQHPCDGRRRSTLRRAVHPYHDRLPFHRILLSGWRAGAAAVRIVQPLRRPPVPRAARSAGD